MYTMLVVDDEYYLRLGFKSLLDWDALGIRIVGEAADGEEGLRLALREKPDLIVADIRMPYMNGLELMEKLRENHIESVVIVLSGFSEFEYAQKAIENGAFAYLLKPIDQDAFLDTVKKALAHIKTEKSSKQYYELLKSELSSMKEVFLKNLLEGAVRDREEIVKKIRMLDVPLDPGNNVAVVIRLDNFLLVRERIGAEQMDALRREAEGEIAKTLLIGPDFMGVLVHMGPDAWCVVVNLCRDVEKGEAAVEAASRRLMEACRKKFQCTFSVGISKVCADVGQLAGAYRSADQTAGFKLLPGINSVACAGDGKGSGYRREIREAVRYVRENYSKDISVESAARHVYISPSYLMHLLRNELGKTFNECLMECRVAAARELLSRPGSRIGEVAQSVGYRDVKYFSRVFKKVTGLNPSEYMELMDRNA